MWTINRKSFAGELYDLTASSTIGLKGFETGKLKNMQGLNYGITETLEKYKNELEIILKDEEDDKFYKRKDIYNLLDYCISIDIELKKIIDLNINQQILPHIISITHANFNELFKFTMNYLNGGDGSSQYINQPLIITVAGGNPLKIFFQILTILYNSDESLNYDKFIEKFYSKIKNNKKQESLLKEILYNIKSLLYTNLYIDNKVNTYNDSLEIINILQLNIYLLTTELKDRFSQILKFSDMDFAIVPNKKTILESYKYYKNHGGSPKRKITRVTRSQTKPVNEPTKKRNLTFQELQEIEEEERKKKNKTKKQKLVSNPKPNSKKTINKKNTNLKTKEIVIDNKNHGFLLIRLKTCNQFKKPFNGLPNNIVSIFKKINTFANKSDDACNNKVDLDILNKSLKLLSQPQLFRLVYLTKPGISDDCKTFLNYLYESKNLISELTSMNINIFIDYLTNNSIDNDTKLSKFMDYLNENSLKQNNLIENLLNCGEEELCKIYKNTEDVILNFESIESICDTNKPLVKVMNKLVLEFSQREEIKNVIEIISNKFSGKDFITRSGDYNNIYITPHLAYELDKSNDSLHYAKKNNLIPSNSKITTNATYKNSNLESNRIKTDKEKEEEENILRDLNNFLAEQDMLDELIPKMANLNIGSKKTKKRKKSKKNKK
tara:strand:- start:478 stop:2475 length:1998 start_codon:yes stop_codon:yes gene_type:complete